MNHEKNILQINFDQMCYDTVLRIDRQTNVFDILSSLFKIINSNKFARLDCFKSKNVFIHKLTDAAKYYWVNGARKDFERKIKDTCEFYLDLRVEFVYGDKND